MSSAERATYEKTSSNTQGKILDAAETLFIEKGFAATSLRAIANLASVNLAATHYHFGSKEGLLSATIHRRIEPINTLRLANLNQLEAEQNYAVPVIIAAMFDPLLSGELDPNLPLLIARVHGEPASISRPLLEREFGEVGARYLAALEKALPGVDPVDLRWRFHMVIGSMVHLLNFPSPLQMAPDKSPQARREGIERLKLFAIAGLAQTGIEMKEEKQ